MITSHNIRYEGREDLLAVQKKVAQFLPDQILIQVFSGVLDLEVVERLVEEVNELFPGSPMIGCSTAGEIVDSESVENTILVSFTLFEHSRAASVLVTQNDNLPQAGRDIGQALAADDLRAVIVLGGGLKDQRTINGEPMLRAIRREIGNIIIAGGQAGDNGQGKTTFTFTEQGITESGAAAAGIRGDRLRVDNTYNLSWVPIGKKLTITEAEGSRVYSIDDQSPYDIYVHYLGQEVADGLPLSAADFPLIIERDDIPLAVHALGVNDDGSFEYIHDFYPGEQLRFGFCHAGLLALGAQVTNEEVRGFAPQALFVYSCVSRKWILGTDIAVELSSFADIAPSAGFFCYGEYYRHENGKPYFFSQTMTVLSLSEGEEDQDKQGALPVYEPTEEASRQFRTMRVLHRLVDKSTREIEVMNEELASLASKDSLTGLFNRRRFDEVLMREVKRQGRAGTPLSLFMLDIDYFKLFNDRYGHVHGDDCLRAAALVFTRVLKRPSDTVARYGGEEFACILPDTDHEGAMRLAEEVRNGVEALHIPHEGSEVAGHVTVSIGVLTVSGNELMEPEELVKACDEQLYAAKEKGRNQVVGRKAGSDVNACD